MGTSLSEEDVRNVAKLARLKLSDAQVHDMRDRLAAVLAYMEKLNRLDVSGVEPMAHAMELSNVLRPDEPRPGMPVDAVLANAPAKEPPFFRVPKVIDDGSGA